VSPAWTFWLISNIPTHVASRVFFSICISSMVYAYSTGNFQLHGTLKKMIFPADIGRIQGNVDPMSGSTAPRGSRKFARGISGGGVVVA